MAIETSNTSTIETGTLDRIFDPLVQSLTPGVARKIVALRMDPELQVHLDKLAEKCNCGMMNESEHADYKTCVRAIHFVTVLQSKARRLLSRHSKT